MRILVGGSLRNIPRAQEICAQFAAALGKEIVSRGHVVLNGCRNSLDKEIAGAAQEWLTANNGNPGKSILSYCSRSDPPIHTFGTIRESALQDWQMDHPELRIPEHIEMADAVIFIAGNEGTFWAKNWAVFARKPILGIPGFGGAGEAPY